MSSSLTSAENVSNKPSESGFTGIIIKKGRALNRLSQSWIGELLYKSPEPKQSGSGVPALRERQVYFVRDKRIDIPPGNEMSFEKEANDDDRAREDIARSPDGSTALRVLKNETAAIEKTVKEQENVASSQFVEEEANSSPTSRIELPNVVSPSIEIGANPQFESGDDELPNKLIIDEKCSYHSPLPPSFRPKEKPDHSDSPNRKTPSKIRVWKKCEVVPSKDNIALKLLPNASTNALNEEEIPNLKDIAPPSNAFKKQITWKVIHETMNSFLLYRKIFLPIFNVVHWIALAIFYPFGQSFIRP